MPPDLPNEQELNLKKRARRRLVGAIALVLLMVIILPQVLQDRAAITQQNGIKITMPEPLVDPKHEMLDESVTQPQVSDISRAEEIVPATDDLVSAGVTANTEATIEDVIASKDAESKRNEPKKPEAVTAVIKTDNKQKAKLAEAKAPEIKKAEVKPALNKVAEIKTPEAKVEPKQVEHFSVQVGVYSDIANVKRLQDQLKQAGFSTTTEKVTTPKGESIRLKAGSFTSRQDAVNALDKLKGIGLSGIVIGND